MAAQDTPTLQFSDSKETARNFLEVEGRYRRALRKQPTDARALYAVGDAHFDRGDNLEALRLLRHAVYMSPHYSPAYRRLGRLYYQLDRREEAGAVYSEWARRNPADLEAQHLAFAAAGAKVPARCADEIIVTHFDTFAASFDEILVNKLAYRGPDIVAAELATHIGSPAAGLDVLDAGCGTGLCGQRVRAWCRSLAGVDLSKEMIARALARDVYTELTVSELCAFMDSRPTAFDTIVSADVLIYFGALESLMRSAHMALRPGGTLVATVEALLDDPERSYRLGIHGRYSHSEGYIRQVVTGSGMSLLKLAPELIRFELGQRVEGYVIVARK